MKHEAIRFTFGSSSLGQVLVASSTRGLRAILIDDDEPALERDLRARFPRASVERDDVALHDVTREVIDFIEHPRAQLEVPLDPAGTEFQQAVWDALREIPPGRTASYGQIAARIGRPRSTRAVGQACGANALAIVVPCHRVIGSSGHLTGFGWGIERKRELLAREGVVTAPQPGGY
ncbi:MAG: methylated-DNA--[protein]-cysteine S-methyltransferase [Gemmatimonadota bacterium]